MMEIKPSVPTVLDFWRICTTIRIFANFDIFFAPQGPALDRFRGKVY
jgi:hypothetical protein